MSEVTPWVVGPLECERCGSPMFERTRNTYTAQSMGRPVRMDRETRCSDPECVSNRGKRWD